MCGVLSFANTLGLLVLKIIITTLTCILLISNQYPPNLTKKNIVSSMKMSQQIVGILVISTYRGIIVLTWPIAILCSYSITDIIRKIE